MARRRAAAVALVLLLTPVVSAQQGVLVNGNSQLPACAQGCQALQQAAQACTGTTSATDRTWVCFCQSAYLTDLKNPATASALCQTACTNPSDSAQIGTWYNTNCGSDFGASEHAGDKAPTTTAAAAAAASSATASASATASSNPFGTSNSGSNSDFQPQQTGTTWWNSHYKWIIMLIVLVIALPLLAWLAVWLKRRHHRKQDLIGGGFNAGITHRAPPPASDPHLEFYGPGSSVEVKRPGSPARTRDAFMPYGYGYNHSDSRLASRQGVVDERRSPLARGETAMDAEKEAAMSADETGQRPKRVLVRERSLEDDIQTLK